MGSVYLAEHLTLERRCAIKLLRGHLAPSLSHAHRFIREAKAASLSAHPNVIEVLDAGHTADGTVYYAMELLEGEDLSATLRAENRLPWPRVRHIALQICEALAASHARDIVHRDLKPANCFRISRGGDPDFIKVLDFGVAKLINSQHETLTGRGDVLGTPCYMAPEQVTGQEIDHRTDIYALGAMLYHMLTGRTAFVGDNPFEIMFALTTRPPEPFSVVAPDLDLPPEVWALVMRAMAHEPAQRFASMQEFAAAIAGIDAKPHATTTEPIITSAPPSAPPETQARARRPAVVATSIAVLVLSVVVVVLLRREPTPQPPPEVPRIILPAPSDPTLPISCRQDLPNSCDAGMHCRGGACVSIPAKTCQDGDPCGGESCTCSTPLVCGEDKICHAPPACTDAMRQFARELANYQATCVDGSRRSLDNCRLERVDERIFTQTRLDTVLSDFPSIAVMLPKARPSAQSKNNVKSDMTWPDTRPLRHYKEELRERAEIFRNAGYILFSLSPRMSEDGIARSNFVRQLLLDTLTEAGHSSSETANKLAPFYRNRKTQHSREYYESRDQGSTVWWSEETAELFSRGRPLSKRESETYREAMDNAVIISVIPQECVTEPVRRAGIDPR